jgi:hypothetical protein
VPVVLSGGTTTGLSSFEQDSPKIARKVANTAMDRSLLYLNDLIKLFIGRWFKIQNYLNSKIGSC